MYLNSWKHMCKYWMILFSYLAESFWRKFLVNNDDVLEEIDKKNCPQLGLLKRDEFEVT